MIIGRIKNANKQSDLLENWRREMDKEFSEGFLHDLADLLDMCSKGDTDTISLSFDINGRQLNVEMTFSVENK